MTPVEEIAKGVESIDLIITDFDGTLVKNYFPGYALRNFMMNPVGFSWFLLECFSDVLKSRKKCQNTSTIERIQELYNENYADPEDFKKYVSKRPGLIFQDSIDLINLTHAHTVLITRNNEMAVKAFNSLSKVIDEAYTGCYDKGLMTIDVVRKKKPKVCLFLGNDEHDLSAIAALSSLKENGMIEGYYSLLRTKKEHLNGTCDYAGKSFNEIVEMYKKLIQNKI
jgi:phosphoglycolate phosphatase-like HAD superfamily hydrolase